MIVIHTFNTFYFASKNGIENYPFLLHQACLNPWNTEFKEQIHEVMPVGKFKV